MRYFAPTKHEWLRHIAEHDFAVPYPTEGGDYSSKHPIPAMHIDADTMYLHITEIPAVLIGYESRFKEFSPAEQENIKITLGTKRELWGYMPLFGDVHFDFESNIVTFAGTKMKNGFVREDYVNSLRVKDTIHRNIEKGLTTYGSCSSLIRLMLTTLLANAVVPNSAMFEGVRMAESNDMGPNWLHVRPHETRLEGAIEDDGQWLSHPLSDEQNGLRIRVSDYRVDVFYINPSMFGEFFRSVCDTSKPFLENMLTMVPVAKAETTEEKEARLLRKGVQKIADRLIGSTRSEYEEIKGRVDRLRRDLLDNVYALVEKERMLGSVEGVMAGAMKAIDNIKNLPDIYALWFEGDEMLFRTGDIFAVVPGDEDGYTRYFGQYKVSLNMATGKIKFEQLNADCVKKGYWDNGSIHPHIAKSGASCLGNLEELVAFSLAHCEYDSIVMAILGFLQTANPDDIAGAKYYEWDAYKDGVLVEIGSEGDICPVCEENDVSDGRVCNICGRAVCEDCYSTLDEDDYVCQDCINDTKVWFCDRCGTYHRASVSRYEDPYNDESTCDDGPYVDFMDKDGDEVRRYFTNQTNLDRWVEGNLYSCSNCDALFENDGDLDEEGRCESCR